MNENQINLVVIVPMYNEERRFDKTAFAAFIKDHPYQFLFVNDGSTDGTAMMLETFCKTHAKCSHLSLPQNCGKAEAVRKGMLQALELNPSHVAFWDADLATPLNAISQLLHVFITHPSLELVMGARIKLLGRDVERKYLRHYLGRVFATFASMVLNLAVYDTQCGAKMFRVTPHFRPLFTESFISRWIFDVEILARLKLITKMPMKNIVFEFPLDTWCDKKGSKLKPTDFLKAFFELFRIGQKYRTYKLG